MRFDPPELDEGVGEAMVDGVPPGIWSHECRVVAFGVMPRKSGLESSAERFPLDAQMRAFVAQKGVPGFGPHPGAPDQRAVEVPP